MANLPITTIVPFNNIAQLPSCATACYHLYDANGACVPPAVPQNQPAAYTSCFCADPRVAPFSTSTAGVCDNACPTDPNGLSSITAWFHNICNIKAPATGTATGTATATQTHAGSATGTGAAPPPVQNLGPGGSWQVTPPAAPLFIIILRNPSNWPCLFFRISHHWQWVIMLVILVLGIAGIWVGACFWRRRYLRKRDLRPAASGQPTSWGSGPPDAAAGPIKYTPKSGISTPTLPTFVSTTEKRQTGVRRWFGS